MELRTYKQINNKYPKFSGGLSSKLVNSIASGIGIAANNYSLINGLQSPQELIDAAPANNASIMGVGYKRLSLLDKNSLLSKGSGARTGNIISSALAGAGTGSAFGLLGAGIGGAVGLLGGLFGSNKAKDTLSQNIDEANSIIPRINSIRRSDAYTHGLQLKYASEYGNSLDGVLFYHAKLGKSPVHTAEGLSSMQPQNANVNLGESIFNEEEEAGHVVTDGPNDTAAANIKPGDTILGAEKNPITGNTFQQDAVIPTAILETINKNAPKSSGWLAELTKETYDRAVKPYKDAAVQELKNLQDIQSLVHAEEGYNFYNTARNGKSPDYPHFYDGAEWWTNAIPTAGQLGAGIYQLLSAAGDTPYRPNIYEQNRYAGNALRTLQNLRVNTYPIANQLRQAEGNMNYALNTSGGISNAQRYLGRIAGYNNMLANIANLSVAAQKENNAYKQTWATHALDIGDKEAQRRQQANEYANTYYAQSHGARSKGIATSIEGILGAINQYNANEFKRRQFNGMMDLYTTEQKLNEKELLSKMNRYKQSNTKPSNTGQSTNVVTSTSNIVIPQGTNAGLLTNINWGDHYHHIWDNPIMRSIYPDYFKKSK